MAVIGLDGIVVSDTLAARRLGPAVPVPRPHQRRRRRAAAPRASAWSTAALPDRRRSRAGAAADRVGVHELRDRRRGRARPAAPHLHDVTFVDASAARAAHPRDHGARVAPRRSPAADARDRGRRRRRAIAGNARASEDFEVLAIAARRARPLAGLRAAAALRRRGARSPTRLLAGRAALPRGARHRRDAPGRRSASPGASRARSPSSPRRRARSSAATTTCDVDATGSFEISELAKAFAGMTRGLAERDSMRDVARQGRLQPRSSTSC